MREDINFKGADRESDFWLISILYPWAELFKGRVPGLKVNLLFRFHTSRVQSRFKPHKIKHLLIHTRSVRTKFQHSKADAQNFVP